MDMVLTAAGALLAAVIAMPMGQASLPAASNTDVVRGDADRYDRMTIPVHIGKNGPYRFLLDTGAQNTVVARSVARLLALPPGRRVTVLGIAGRQAVDTVEIDEIMLGRRSFYGLLAPLLEREHIGADGILGIDSLQDQRVLLDFTRNMIAVDDARALGGDAGYEIVVKARRLSGQLIMTNALIDGVRTDVVIDTGAQSTIGNLALQRALSRRMKTETAVINSVTGQQITADIGLARQLTIGTLNLNNVAIAFTDAPPFEALDLNKRPALLLGMRELRVFRRVAIDFTTRRILFDLPRGV
jgi:predicted aspartyl protease